MSGRPEFAIVAGPNGAGKSRIGPFFSKARAFDGDRLAMALREAHPGWKDSWVSGTVAGELVRQKDEAVKCGRDFAFETNFASELPLTLAREFRSAGYRLSLIYIGLPSVQACMARVAHRLANGGHDIPDDLIRYNYTEGIRQTRQHLGLFDDAVFVDGAGDFGDVVAIHLGGSGVHAVTDHPCKWFGEYFREAFDKTAAL